MEVVRPVVLLNPYLEAQKFDLCMDYDKVNSFLLIADASIQLISWRPLLAESGFDDVQESSFKSKADKALVRPNTGGTYIIELDNDLPERKVSLVEQRRKNINSDYDRNLNLFCISH